MTTFGLATLLGGLAALVLGLTFDWLAFDLVGLGLLGVVVLGFAVVVRPSRLTIRREIQPPRVPKGSPAIAFLTFANRGRRTIPVTIATQAFGTQRVRTVIPKLRGGERGTRAYRLPTTRRGVFDVEPVELTRRDSFELFRRSRRQADVERIWVYPRVVGLAAVPTGQTRNLEGPSSDTSPQGTITFHRLRDYVEGDDLRLVHWRSSARAGKLLVRHNVDTSQPYTVVLVDHRPSRYTEAAFEQAVDVAASVVTAAAAHKSPVELRTTDGTVVGGPRLRDATPLIDHLTGIAPATRGDLRTELIRLRRNRGGTSLVVITGEIEPLDLPHVAALRRRFDRLVVVSLDPRRTPVPRFPGLRIIVGADADEVASAWNFPTAR